MHLDCTRPTCCLLKRVLIAARAYIVICRNKMRAEDGPFHSYLEPGHIELPLEVCAVEVWSRCFMFLSAQIPQNLHCALLIAIFLAQDFKHLISWNSSSVSAMPHNWLSGLKPWQPWKSPTWPWGKTSPCEPWKSVARGLWKTEMASRISVGSMILPVDCSCYLLSFHWKDCHQIV